MVRGSYQLELSLVAMYPVLGSSIPVEELGVCVCVCVIV